MTELLKRIAAILVVLVLVGGGWTLFVAMNGEVQPGGEKTCTAPIGVECVCKDGCTASLTDCDCTS